MEALGSELWRASLEALGSGGFVGDSGLRALGALLEALGSGGFAEALGFCVMINSGLTSEPEIQIFLQILDVRVRVIGNRFERLCLIRHFHAKVRSTLRNCLYKYLGGFDRLSIK